MKNFSYVENKDRGKLVILFFILLLTNIFELLGIGLIPLYIFAISSNEMPQINSFFELQFLSSLTFHEVLILSSVVLVLFFIIKNILTIILYKIEIKIFTKFVTDNASKLFKFYLERPYSFFESTKPSEIIKNISVSNNQAAESLRSKILIIKELLFIFFVFVLLFYTNVKITLSILLLLIAISLIFFFTYKKKLFSIGSLAQLNQQEQFQILNNSFNGIKEVKIFKIENVLMKIFNKETEGLTNRYYLGTYYVKLPRIFYEIIAILLMVILIFLVIYQEQDFQSSLPILSLYLVALMRFIPSFSLLNSSINSINFNGQAEKIILNKLKFIRELNKDISNIELEEFNTKDSELNLEITNLNFSYSSNESEKIINNLNLIIKKGEKVCIYGKSGEGKSTLIDLITGLIQPSSGSIKFNKKNININFKSWLNFITYVPQKVFVFDDSLLQNICFKQILSKEEKLKLEKILEEVQLKEFVNSLPDGINTTLGNMGFKISGGQIQRIGIARALFRNSKIIILDESTNSLDKKTEQDILSIFKSVDYNDKIIISISHDDQTFKYFNKILFLKNGKILHEKKD
jgi:ATP-binding cassette, subfamily B, bacterial PglK